MSGIVTIYAVFANEEEALRIGRTVVEEKLAACVNVLGPCQSIYRWQGRIEESRETPAIFKTGAEQADRLAARIVELHSYEVPCVAVWEIGSAHGPYRDWVKASVED